MKFKEVMFLLFIGVLLITLVSMGMTMASAEMQSIPPVKQGNCITLKQTCGNCTFNNITSVVAPNGSAIVGQIAMSKVGTEYNYTNFCHTNTSGTYVVNGFGDPDAINTVWAYDFDVNPQGIEQNQSRTEAITRTIYIVFGVSLILFIAFLFSQKVPIKWTFFILSFVFFIIGLNVLSISLADEVVNTKLEDFFDSFTAISIYIYWFAAGVLAIMWFFTFLNTYLYKKNMEAFQKYG